MVPISVGISLSGARMGDKPIVKIDQGKLRGKKCIAEYSRKEYYSFLGIPYAMPPIGKLRFKVIKKRMSSASDDNDWF